MKVNEMQMKCKWSEMYMKRSAIMTSHLGCTWYIVGNVICWECDYWKYNFAAFGIIRESDDCRECWFVSILLGM